MRKTLFIFCSFAALAMPTVALADDPPAERTTTVTGSNGGGFTSTTTGSRDQDAGTWQRETNTDFNNGTTRNVTVDGQSTGQGTADVTRTVTRRNGETAVQTGSVETTRTENGRVTTGDWQGENGAFTTRREVVREENSRTVTGQATGENGRTRTTQNEVTRTAPGEGVFNRTVTGPGGNVRTQEGTVTRTRRRP